MIHNKNKLFYFFIFIFSCTYFLTPVGAVEHGDVLVNGTGTYLKTGERWTFYQGYVIVLKGVNQEGDQAWLELLLEDDSVKDMILSEGERFIYSYNSEEIFNITVDTIYSGSMGELIALKPVYQYSNPDLPNPTPTENAVPNETLNESTSETGTEVENTAGFAVVLGFFSICAAALMKMKHKR
ncbi:MAG: hypothetical protein JXA38_07065 [Methanosarcinaceae archaeon]|nr:hypothetical protein [Methanosarcinaceae archaeon]